MEILQQNPELTQGKFRSRNLSENFQSGWQSILQFFTQIKTIGFAEGMDDYEKRKLGIFNQLNFFQLFTGILIPLVGLLHHDKIPFHAWRLACLPASISIIVLLFNYFKKYEIAQLIYFLLYPFFTGFVYLKGMNMGVELHFILYGVLSVFFLQDIGYMAFSIAISMINYFLVSIVLKQFIYQVETENKFLYLFNQLLAIGFIFYGLILIKKENAGYQFRILAKHRTLHKKNQEIKKQKEELVRAAKLLEKQKAELSELNLLNNKLFSVISHDLKSPMYALRNLFRTMLQQNSPAEEMKKTIPDVLMDLNYTIGLMENLLQWSKTQMQANNIHQQELDISKMIAEALQLIRLPAEAKQICIEIRNKNPAYVFADKDMVNLVLRNLLSNAIKFTPQHGSIVIGINEINSFVEVYVQDSGTGIGKEALEKINENNFYTTKGTANESGTGLGLMLCKEFLLKNDGQMHIESEPGKGSIFSFTLPKS